MSRHPSLWIEQRRAKLAGKLSRMQASRRPMIMEGLRKVYESRCSSMVSLATIIFVVSVCAWIFNLDESAHPPLILILAIVFAFAFLIVGIPMIIVFVVHSLWAIPLDERQVQHLNSWITSYPCVRSTCVRWARERASPVLHSIDFYRIAPICGKLEQLDKKQEAHRKAMEYSRQQLEDIGVIAEIQSLHDQDQLQAATTDQLAPGPASVARL